jgi:hypothetical protein
MVGSADVSYVSAESVQYISLELPREKQRREEAVSALEDFAYRLGMDCRLAIFTESVWANGPAIQMLVPSGAEKRTPDTKFYLRPNDADEFQLFQEIPGSEPSEVMLAKLHRKDPQFANRMLVAIGNRMEKIMQGGLDGK